MDNGYSGHSRETLGEEKEGGPEKGREDTFGDYFRLERERRNLTLDDLARAVRVPRRYLEAMEEDDFRDLPPETYVRGFLEACCGELSLDSKELLRRYERAHHEHLQSRRDEGKGAIFALFRPRGAKFRLRDWSMPLILTAIACVFLAGRWFLDRGPGGEEGDAPLPLPAISGSPLRADPSAGKAAVPPESEKLAKKAAVGVRLFLSAEGSTWVSAESDGLGGVEWIMREGETKELTAVAKLVLSLGNAGVVRLTYNGRVLGFIGQKGEVKRGLVFAAEED
jgi:transcriptional regulator with XRE-family HTH domain